MMLSSLLLNIGPSEYAMLTVFFLGGLLGLLLCALSAYRYRVPAPLWLSAPLLILYVGLSSAAYHLSLALPAINDLPLVSQNAVSLTALSSSHLELFFFTLTTSVLVTAQSFLLSFSLLINPGKPSVNEWRRPLLSLILSCLCVFFAAVACLYLSPASLRESGLLTALAVGFTLLPVLLFSLSLVRTPQGPSDRARMAGGRALLGGLGLLSVSLALLSLLHLSAFSWFEALQASPELRTRVAFLASTRLEHLEHLLPVLLAITALAALVGPLSLLTDLKSKQSVISGLLCALISLPLVGLSIYVVNGETALLSRTEIDTDFISFAKGLTLPQAGGFNGSPAKGCFIRLDGNRWLARSYPAGLGLCPATPAPIDSPLNIGQVTVIMEANSPARVLNAAHFSTKPVVLDLLSQRPIAAQSSPLMSWARYPVSRFTRHPSEPEQVQRAAFYTDGLKNDWIGLLGEPAHPLSFDNAEREMELSALFKRDDFQPINQILYFPERSWTAQDLLQAMSSIHLARPKDVSHSLVPASAFVRIQEGHEPPIYLRHTEDTPR